MPSDRPENKYRKRKIDLLTKDVFSSTKNSFSLVATSRVKTWKAFLVLAIALGAAVGTILTVKMRMESKSRAEAVSFYIQKMKTKGCIADGLLTGSGGDTAGSIGLIKRSKCEYLHRAVETWAAPPDFNLVSKNMQKFGNSKMIFGMFLAEAIGTNSEYYYPDEKRNFDFSKMCREGSEGFWGPGTCKAFFGSPEYRKYLQYITREAIDLGIQSFLFGQIYFQDNSNSFWSWAGSIVDDMRGYAASKGRDIVIGAQTNDITNEKYLKIFDYIEGGVGEDDQGNIENGPCLSRWWKKPGDRCWALLWNEKYAAKANNVLLHLDWSGLSYDDMSRFARMNSDTRAKTLDRLYRFFQSKNMGFLMPYLAVVDDRNAGGCFGPKPDYYSPDNKYSCRDEDIITAIFEGRKIGNDARFASPSLPSTMISGQNYQVSVSVTNTGTSYWSAGTGFRMGSQNPQDNNFWGGRIDLNSAETINPGETKIFNFSVTAPSAPGVYDFQWRMLQENVEWFGGLSENVHISVEPSAGNPTGSLRGKLPIRDIKP